MIAKMIVFIVLLKLRWKLNFFDAICILPVVMWGCCVDDWNQNTTFDSNRFLKAGVFTPMPKKMNLLGFVWRSHWWCQWSYAPMCAASRKHWFRALWRVWRVNGGACAGEHQLQPFAPISASCNWSPDVSDAIWFLMTGTNNQIRLHAPMTQRVEACRH